MQITSPLGETDLSEQLYDLEFLLDVPKYERTKNVLPLLQDLKSRRLDVRSSLDKVLTIIRHESADVKCLGLNKLRIILKMNLCAVYKLILDAENVDSIIPQLIDQLLVSLNHSDANVRYSASVCLGELGAIDPGRLQSNAVCAKVFEKKVYHVADFDGNYNMQFVVDLLTELSNCLAGSSDGSSYNVFSFVIQESLKFFDCRSPDDETPNSSSQAIFKELSPNVQTIVAPFFKTQ